MSDANGFSSEELQLLYGIFVSSGREQTARMRGALESIRHGGGAGEDLELLHRAAHSLKGAALQLGIVHIGRLALALESVFKPRVAPPAAALELLEEALGRVDGYLDGLERQEHPPDPPAELIGRLEALAGEFGSGQAGQAREA